MIQSNKNIDYYFVPYISKQPIKLLQSDIKAYIPFSNISSMYTPYSTADILIIEDDIITRTIFDKKMKNYVIKKDEQDKGRPIKYKIMSTSKQLLEDVVNCSSYGLILIDENLGPDNLSGSQCIRRLRDNNYKGAIISISGTYKSTEIRNRLKKSGSNGLIPKSDILFSELYKLLRVLTKRKLE